VGAEHRPDGQGPTRRGPAADDSSSCLDSAEYGHADFHQREIGSQVPRLGDGFVADKRRVGLCLEDLAQANADGRLSSQIRMLVIGLGRATRTLEPRSRRRSASRRPPKSATCARILTTVRAATCHRSKRARRRSRRSQMSRGRHRFIRKALLWPRLHESDKIVKAASDPLI
jgi:hypothetical protein